jgi:ClpP class serine protease
MTMADEPKRRAIRPGEILAIRSDVVQEDRGAFFWLFGPPAAKPERIGDVSVIRINGPLEYHDDGYGESYDAIVDRTAKAMSGEDMAEEWRRAHRWDDDYDADKAPVLTPPKAVVFRIDSPGGVVAGLDQTVNKLRAMSRDAKIPLLAYVDETAYSAAFALSCACSQIVLPRAGMLGSIGVISTLADVTKADRKAGIRFVVLTSGARKADGHPHVPIDDAMIAEERPRVAQLARQFFSVVKRARGIPIDRIKSWEAGRFLGAEATRAGLADAVLSWDEFLATLQATGGGTESKNRVAQPGTRVPTSKAETKMGIELDALITRTTAAIASEKDPTKLASLAAKLDAYKKTKHSIEKHETEEGDEEEEDEESGDETDRGDDPEDDEDDDDDGDEDEDDEESAESEEEEKRASVSTIVRAAGMAKGKDRKAFRAAVTKAIDEYGQRASAAGKVMQAAETLTGKRGASAIVEALKGLAEGGRASKDRLAALEKESRENKRNAAVNAALADNRITKREARTLRGKKLAFVEEFLQFRTGAVVQTKDDLEREPGASPRRSPGAVVPGQGGTLPADLEKIVQNAIASAKAQGLKDVTRETIIQGMNGAARAVPEV